MDKLGINLGYLLFQIFNFLILMILLYAFAYRPIVRMLENRKQKIAQGKTVADARVWFGIATHGPWSTPNSQGVSVFVDTDLDGTDDFEVFTGWIGATLLFSQEWVWQQIRETQEVAIEKSLKGRGMNAQQIEQAKQATEKMTAIVARVGGCLVQGRVQAKCLAAFRLEMQFRNGGDDVGRLVAAAVLTPAACLDAKQAPDLGGRLALAELALVPRSKSHDVRPCRPATPGND